MSPNAWEQNAVYLQSGDPETENTPVLQAPGLLGSRFTVVQPTRNSGGTGSGRSKRYQLVKTDSTMTVAPYEGAVAYWADKTQYMVTTVNTNLNLVAGRFCNQVTRGNYGCIQVTGPGYTKIVDSEMAAIAAGESVIGSATAGKATRIAIGTAPTHVVLGRVASPITKRGAEALVLVDLDVPETL